MATLKFSRQRETIRQYLHGRTDHPTAEMIYSDLKEEDPRLSLGTVYRNLSLLSQLGEIRRIPAIDGPDRYDGDVSPHYHFICRQCHCVSDLRLDDHRLSQVAASCVDGRLDGVILQAYGLCSSCLSAAGAPDGLVSKTEPDV